MPAPIYLPQRQQNPMATMLQQLVMMKMQHNMEIDRAKTIAEVELAGTKSAELRKKNEFDRQLKLKQESAIDTDRFKKETAAKQTVGRLETAGIAQKVGFGDQQAQPGQILEQDITQSADTGTLVKVGNQLYSVNAPKGQQFNPGTLTLTKIPKTALEEKISTIMGAVQGLSKEDATKIATGVVRVQKDPVTNEISLVDLATNTARSVSTADTATPQKQGNAPRTIWDLAGKGTGAMSGIKAGASIASGMVGGPVAGQTIQARQYITNAQNDLVRALSINPRFPVGEINRIREEINIAPQFFDSPKGLQNRAIAINDYLEQRISNETRAAGDRSIPAPQRQAAKQAANDIRNFLKILGVPKKVTAENYSSIKSGEQFIDPEGNIRTKK